MKCWQRQTLNEPPSFHSEGLSNPKFFRSKKRMDSFEVFALNQISQPIALLTIDKDKALSLQFANEALVKFLLNTTTSEEVATSLFNIFKDEYTIFQNIIHRCLQEQNSVKDFAFCSGNNIIIHKRFVVMLYLHQILRSRVSLTPKRTPLFVSFYPYNSVSICVIFNTSTHDDVLCKCNIRYFEQQHEKLVSLSARRSRLSFNIH